MGNILVLSVDRDDDLGVKTGIKGPLIGRKKVLDAAQKLILTDPTESDANVLFEAVRMRDRLAKEGKKVEVGAITGDRMVGLKSEKVISDQLDSILKKYKASQILLVSDGREDEIILPMLAKRVESASPHRLIVQQAESWEETAFILQRYIRAIMEDTKTRGIFVGIPGITLLIWAFFKLLYVLGLTRVEQSPWPFIFAIIGFYLIRKGFALDRFVTEEILAKRFTLFTYFVALVLVSIGVYLGFIKVGKNSQIFIYKAMEFVKYANPYISFGFLVALIGKAIDSYSQKRLAILSFSRIWSFLAALLWMIYQASLYFLSEIQQIEFIRNCLIALVLTLVIFGFTYAQEEKKKGREFSLGK
ncbi:MAG: DUF373 family protein [Candidatus Methanofastidiosia archaeon]